MSAWSAMGVVVVVAVMTYAMRAVAIVALARREIPLSVERVLRNVGPAVLAALAINLAAGGEDGSGLQWAEAIALAATGVVAWWRKSVLWSLGAGMVTLWILTALA